MLLLVPPFVKGRGGKPLNLKPVYNFRAQCPCENVMSAVEDLSVTLLCINTNLSLGRMSFCFRSMCFINDSRNQSKPLCFPST